MSHQTLVSACGYGLTLLAGGLWFATLPGCNSASNSSPPATVVTGANDKDSTAWTDDQLRSALDEMIEHTKNRHLSPQVNNAWQIVHALLAYGRELQLDDHDRKQLIPAMDSMLQDKVKVRGWTFVIAEKGIEAPLEEGKIGQGHEDQWLGYLSQSGIKLDDQLIVHGEKFKVRDLLTQAQWDTRQGMEATWTLMAAGKYLDLNDKWTARDGSEWSIERLIDMESGQKLSESACGGSHRMYAIASALQKRLAAGGELTGGWSKANDRVQDTIRRGREFQQPDGGFSTEFFERSATSSEIQLRINTTGHVFEFLALALNDEELRSPWMRRAAIFLTQKLQMAKDLPLECGGLYHAAHGLILYRERMFGPRPSSSNAAPAPTVETVSDAPAPPSAND